MKKIILPLFVLILCFVAGFFIQKGSNSKTDSYLIYFDVGQGDCTLLRDQNMTLLIDAGPNTPQSRAGVKELPNKIEALGIKKIELVILTHPDMDHVGGFATLNKRFKIGKVCIPYHFQNNEKMINILNRAGYPLSQVMWIKNRTDTSIGRFKVQMTAPSPQGVEKDNNEGSLFTKISWDKASAVSTGDASLFKENQMCYQKNMDWSAQILKAGHHGSYLSTGKQWIEKVHPEYVVISCGKNNPYHHPHKPVLQRIKQKNLSLFRTDQKGDLIFIPTSKGFKIHNQSTR